MHEVPLPASRVSSSHFSVWTAGFTTTFNISQSGRLPYARGPASTQAMHFEDLTPYTYCPEENEPPALNIGWLDISVPFPKGEASKEFIERLKSLIQNRTNQTRGFQICGFCEGLDIGIDENTPFDTELYAQCHSDGRYSSAEIRVQGPDGIWYAAPRMIAHYVEAHSYKPPEQFIAAVLQTQ